MEKSEIEKILENIDFDKLSASQKIRISRGMLESFSGDEIKKPENLQAIIANLLQISSSIYSENEYTRHRLTQIEEKMENQSQDISEIKKTLKKVEKHVNESRQKDDANLVLLEKMKQGAAFMQFVILFLAFVGGVWAVFEFFIKKTIQV